MKKKPILLKVVLILSLVCLASIINFFIEANEGKRSGFIAESNRSKVAINMTRTAAIKLLEKDAWQHKACEYDDWYEDIFFYGSRNLELVGIVYIRSVHRNDEYRIDFAGSVEDYQLFLYDRCKTVFMR